MSKKYASHVGFLVTDTLTQAAGVATIVLPMIDVFYVHINEATPTTHKHTWSWSKSTKTLTITSSDLADTSDLYVAVRGI